MILSKSSILSNNETNDIVTYQSNLANVYIDLGRREEATKLLDVTLKSDLTNERKKSPRNRK